MQYTFQLHLTGGAVNTKKGKKKKSGNCFLQSDRGGEGDRVSVFGVGGCGQWGGHDVVGAVANQNEEVVTRTTLYRATQKQKQSLL